MSDKKFQNFVMALGEVMADGLNKMPHGGRKSLADALDNGGTIYAVCSTIPAYVVGYLRYNGKDVELFRVSEEEPPPIEIH